ncbi:unnamed protein product [Fraxinus pennsylvanica]|uniref:X8 domain-containing protein n=1 Tax=Fraxinus pennsylvanica TaxID=56036 RepID=A0AAD2DIS9_9LAMI|nr:unnamed protein product [Fraxinus pennsylvanica]
MPLINLKEVLFNYCGILVGATWCICKDGLSNQALQKALDYACGAGADRTHQNGPCFTPNTVRAHCNYAVNSYFQRKGQTPTAQQPVIFQALPTQSHLIQVDKHMEQQQETAGKLVGQQAVNSLPPIMASPKSGWGL